MKADAVERAEAKTQRLIDQAVGANLNGTSWPVQTRRDLTPDQKIKVRKLTHRKAMAGKEHAELNDLPVLEMNEKIAPARGQLLARAMSEKVQDILPEKRHRLLCVLAAYADGGTQSPPVRSLAARMHTTVPNVLYLLHDLEMKGWLKVKWAKEPGKSNKYTILWLDA